MDYEKMKQQAEKEQDRIELRSEKIRNIVGQVPPFLIRWGNVILFIILILLFVAFVMVTPF